MRKIGEINMLIQAMTMAIQMMRTPFKKILIFTVFKLIKRKDKT
jgi:hypothetical protein